MRIATAGVGIPAITTVGVSAVRAGVATARADIAVADSDGDAVAVAELLVAGVGVAAVSTGRGRVTARGVVVALLGSRVIRLTGRRTV